MLNHDERKGKLFEENLTPVSSNIQHTSFKKTLNRGMTLNSVRTITKRSETRSPENLKEKLSQSKHENRFTPRNKWKTQNDLPEPSEIKEEVGSSNFESDEIKGDPLPTNNLQHFVGTDFKNKKINIQILKKNPYAKGSENLKVEPLYISHQKKPGLVKVKNSDFKELSKGDFVIGRNEKYEMSSGKNTDILQEKKQKPVLLDKHSQKVKKLSFLDKKDIYVPVGAYSSFNKSSASSLSALNDTLFQERRAENLKRLDYLYNLPINLIPSGENYNEFYLPVKIPLYKDEVFYKHSKRGGISDRYERNPNKLPSEIEDLENKSKVMFKLIFFNYFVDWLKCIR